MPSPTAVVGISNAPERSRTSTSLFSSQGPQPRAGLADISEPCVTCLGSPGYSFSAPNILRTAEAQIAATPGHPVSVITRPSTLFLGSSEVLLGSVEPFYVRPVRSLSLNLGRRMGPRAAAGGRDRRTRFARTAIPSAIHPPRPPHRRRVSRDRRARLQWFRPAAECFPCRDSTSVFGNQEG